jgi:hypothetical protein
MAASPYKFQYAVKFICTSNIPGTSQTSDSVAPGSYTTAVNIHNPVGRVKFRRKVAAPGVISKFVTGSLKADEATRVTCDMVSKDYGPFIHGFEGFLVIESTGSLDVIAVYTAAANGQVASMHIEDVRERKLA